MYEINCDDNLIFLVVMCTQNISILVGVSFLSPFKTLLQHSIKTLKSSSHCLSPVDHRGFLLEFIRAALASSKSK